MNGQKIASIPTCWQPNKLPESRPSPAPAFGQTATSAWLAQTSPPETPVAYSLGHQYHLALLERLLHPYTGHLDSIRQSVLVYAKLSKPSLRVKPCSRERTLHPQLLHSELARTGLQYLQEGTSDATAT